MAAWVPRRSGTFLMVSGTNQDPERRHLFIICTNPDKDGQVLLASISSKPEGYSERYDATCPLTQKAHAFLNRASYVAYRHARIENTSVLQKRLANKAIEPREDLRPAILEEICAGFAKSAKTPPECQIFYEQNKSR